MDTSTIVASVRQKFDLLCPIMTERMRRQWAASEALALPRGGMALVAQATGLSRTTIWAGVRELQNPSAARRCMGIAGGVGGRAAADTSSR